VAFEQVGAAHVARDGAHALRETGYLAHPGAASNSAASDPSIWLAHDG
jgi:hypothetical protein